MSGSIFGEKRYPTSQRTIVLQFGSPEEAAAWDAAGAPMAIAWPVSHAASVSEEEQNERDDRQDDQNGPKHGRRVPNRGRRQP